MSDEKQLRCQRANSFIRIVGSHGRRFFYNKKRNEFARLEIDHRGRIWLIDEYQGARIYTHYRYRWRGFSNGGTLRMIVERLRDYVRTGNLLPRGIIYWPKWYCDGNLWGYSAIQMACVRAAAKQVGIFQTSEETVTI